jgi:hypothetical protein
MKEDLFYSRDPFRKPNWRWLLATDLLLRGRRALRWHDPAIYIALVFQRRVAAGTVRADRAMQRDTPQLSKAYALYTKGFVICNEVEARLLAGETFPAIAAKVRLNTGVIEAYERFFFNVSDSLHARDWLLQEVLNIGVWRRRPLTEGEIWKYIALTGVPTA